MYQEYPPSQEQYADPGVTPRATSDRRQGYIQSYPNSVQSYEYDGAAQQQQQQPVYDHAPIVPPRESLRLRLTPKFRSHCEHYVLPFLPSLAYS